MPEMAWPLQVVFPLLVENTEKTMAHTEGHILVLELAQGPALAHWHIYWHGV